MATARILQVCDAVAANINSLWAALTGDTPVGTSQAQRVYEVPVGADAEQNTVTDRQVYVFPIEFAKPSDATRKERYQDYTLEVVTAERYTGPAPTPDAWLDVRVTFVEQVIWLPLSDPRQPNVLSGVYNWRPSEVVAYDVNELVKNKLFLSWVKVTLRELI